VKTAIALIDGEHYLPVTKAALEKIAQDYDLKAAVFIGGTEKIADESELAGLGVEIVKESSSAEAMEDKEQAVESLIKALEIFKPELVIDLSDEPVLDYTKRFTLASIALKHGVSYRGADFLFNPPRLENILNKPSIAIIGTGKRVGKTAVSAYISRLLKKDFNPVVLAMGRGGPTEPEILEGDKLDLTPQYLLEQSRQGKHAASDYYEDALMSRVRTIGCRRAGGGLAGQPFISNVLEGAKKANGLDNDLVILEGSGSAIPPVKADKNILVIGAYQNLQDIGGYFGPYRLMIADLIVITMCEEPQASPGKIQQLLEVINNVNPAVPVVLTVFRPAPLQKIAGRKVLVATTAKDGLEKIKSHLEQQHGAQVVAITNQLSNRPLLLEAIKAAGDFDVLLTELKAAAVDVATSTALDLGKEVVYMDNNPVSAFENDLDSAVLKLVQNLV